MFVPVQPLVVPHTVYVPAMEVLITAVATLLLQLYVVAPDAVTVIVWPKQGFPDGVMVGATFAFTTNVKLEVDEQAPLVAVTV